MATCAAVTLSAGPAHAEAGGQETVTGYTQAQCDAAGAARAQQLQNEGYITTFVGCSYDGFSSVPYVGTVSYREGGGTGGQDPVSGWTQAACDSAGAAQAQLRQNQGYTTTFVGCSYAGTSSPPYQGTVLYHEGNWG